MTKIQKLSSAAIVILLLIGIGIISYPALRDKVQEINYSRKEKRAERINNQAARELASQVNSTPLEFYDTPYLSLKYPNNWTIEDITNEIAPGLKEGDVPKRTLILRVSSPKVHYNDDNEYLIDMPLYRIMIRVYTADQYLSGFEPPYNSDEEISRAIESSDIEKFKPAGNFENLSKLGITTETKFVTLNGKKGLFQLLTSNNTYSDSYLMFLSNKKLIEIRTFSLAEFPPPSTFANHIPSGNFADAFPEPIRPVLKSISVK